MKTMLCEINTTPGDFEGNIQQIKDHILEGWNNDADLIVFPELSIPGYLCKDMMFRNGFIDKNLSGLQQIVAFCDTLGLAAKKHFAVIVGYIDANRSGIGKPFRNNAAVIQDGVVKATYTKQLLPFYDVFDEGRYFEPGTDLTIIDIDGHRWGIIICEDGWNDKGMDDYNYRVCPIQRYREVGVSNIISINSSPFVVDKPTLRENMISQASRLSQGKLIYVNQFGGQDELLFDGNSFIVDNGDIVFRTSRDKSFNFYDDALENDAIHQYYPYRKEDDIHRALVAGLEDYVLKSGFKDVVVCSSGGIDSAVVLALACEALGSSHVNAIAIPSKNNSSSSLADAIQLHKNLGCNSFQVGLDYEPLLKHINSSLATTSLPEKYYPVADENIQARMRGLINMHFSNSRAALPLTTGNKTELALGYCTLYGDMTGGFAPISDLYKMEVYKLAAHINSLAKFDLIPSNIINKTPSAELAPDQTDEASLMPYPILDHIVKTYVEGYVGDYASFLKFYVSYDSMKTFWDTHMKMELPANESDFIRQYNRMIALIDKAEFKRRQAAPGIKIHKVAFGSGRRIPIIKK